MAKSDAPRSLSRCLRVRSVNETAVELEVSQASACGACALRSGCGAGALAEMAGLKTFSVPLPTNPPAPGDQVELSVPGNVFLRMVALAFLLPAGALVVAVVVGSAAGLTDIAVAFVAALALILSFWPLRIAEQRGGLVAELTFETPEDG